MNANSNYVVLPHVILMWHAALSHAAPNALPFTSFLSPSPPTIEKTLQGFPGGAVVENLPANAGDTGSSPGLGRSHMPQRTRPVSHNY